MNIREYSKVIDPLYGPIILDPFLSKLILQPEVQRLRDVRLSNINSMLITGISNVSRFEHSVGVAYLAQLLSQKLNLSQKESYTLQCAALLHDVSITPFGHLMEESFIYAGLSFDHEKKLYEIMKGDSEVGNQDFQIYKGKTIGFRKVLNYTEYRNLGLNVNEILDCIQGNGALGPLLNGTIDIDNIDNVCRMAWHLGLSFRRGLPLEIIDIFSKSKGLIIIQNEKEHLLKEWLDLRARLYNILMTNPIDFVSKSMLIHAFRMALVGNNETPALLNPSDWTLTDSEIMEKLQDYELTKEIIRKFQCGELYNLIGLFWISSENVFPKKIDYQKIEEIRVSIAEALKITINDLLIYVIKDKRHRELRHVDTANSSNKFNASHNDDFLINEKNKKNPPEILIGISSKHDINKKDYKEIINSKLKDFFQVNEITECDWEKHIDDSFLGNEINQKTLF
jgi:uncharacterized protein